MAKTRRKTFEQLPLDEPFYASLKLVARRLGLGALAGEPFAHAVAELSRVYTRDRQELTQEAASPQALLARLGFFLPRDMVKVFGPFFELERAQRLPVQKTLRVLDLGAGMGAMSLGLARYLRRQGHPVTSLEVTALEREQRALQAFRELARELSTNEGFVPLALDAREADVRDASVKGPFDLALFGFVLNELFVDEPLERRLEKRVELLTHTAEKLRAGGALIVLEPALKQNARELMQLRDRLVSTQRKLHVFAPCVRTGPCPMLGGDRDWCHEELAYALPLELAEIARGAGLRYEGLSYAALVLTKSPRVLPSLETGETLYRIVSERLESKGKLELYGCGEGGYVRLTRLERDERAENQAFGELKRGDVASVHSQREGRIDKSAKVARL